MDSTPMICELRIAAERLRAGGEESAAALMDKAADYLDRLDEHVMDGLDMQELILRSPAHRRLLRQWHRDIGSGRRWIREDSTPENRAGLLEQDPDSMDKSGDYDFDWLLNVVESSRAQQVVQGIAVFPADEFQRLHAPAGPGLSSSAVAFFLGAWEEADKMRGEGVQDRS